MRNLTLLILAIFVVSCKTPEEKQREKATKDSITYVVLNRLNKSTIESDFNNPKLKNAPLEIVYCKFIPRQYSDDKDIELAFKNVSKKIIVAVKFSWYGVNAFGDPAKMGIYKGYGSGMLDEVYLKPNEESVGVWNVYSNDGKKIIGSRPEEIVFEDGTKWQLNN